MKIYLLAGEASGDIHGSEIVREVRNKFPKAKIRCKGGPAMVKAGAELAFDYRLFAIMGFIEVLRQFRTIKNYFKDVEKDIRVFDPDKIIFIDFPGFNLRLAKKLYPDFELHYYIAPKAWAWNKKRVHSLAKYFKSVSCILPFEPEFFKPYSVKSEYVGNPSKNQVQEYKSKNPQKEEDYIAIFPGSRKQEIERILPVMLEAIRSFGMSYKISQAPGLEKEVYLPYLNNDEDLIKENYELLNNAKAALVTSGTATLETALFEIPQVVCYIANPISYAIASRLVKIKYISLVNLILDRSAVKELIQHDCNVESIKSSLSEILEGESRKNLLQGYKDLNVLLGNSNAAKEVVKKIMAIG